MEATTAKTEAAATGETGAHNVTPNGERLDAPGVEVVVADPSGRKVERVAMERCWLEVDLQCADTVRLLTKYGMVYVERTDLQRLLPALTLYANTGSMVAEDAAKPERHDGCNGGVV